MDEEDLKSGQLYRLCPQKCNLWVHQACVNESMNVGHQIAMSKCPGCRQPFRRHINYWQNLKQVVSTVLYQVMWLNFIVEFYQILRHWLGTQLNHLKLNYQKNFLKARLEMKRVRLFLASVRVLMSSHFLSKLACPQTKFEQFLGVLAIINMLGIIQVLTSNYPTEDQLKSSTGSDDMDFFRDYMYGPIFQRILKRYQGRNQKKTRRTVRAVRHVIANLWIYTWSYSVGYICTEYIIPHGYGINYYRESHYLSGLIYRLILNLVISLTKSIFLAIKPHILKFNWNQNHNRKTYYDFSKCPKKREHPHPICTYCQQIIRDVNYQTPCYQCNLRVHTDCLTARTSKCQQCQRNYYAEDFWFKVKMYLTLLINFGVDCVRLYYYISYWYQSFYQEDHRYYRSHKIAILLIPIFCSLSGILNVQGQLQVPRQKNYLIISTVIDLGYEDVIGPDMPSRQAHIILQLIYGVEFIIAGPTLYIYRKIAPLLVPKFLWFSVYDTFCAELLPLMVYFMMRQTEGTIRFLDAIVISTEVQIVVGLAFIMYFVLLMIKMLSYIAFRHLMTNQEIYFQPNHQ